MQINITYPASSGKKEFRRRRMLNIMRWPFISAALICPVLNYLLGGKAWSLVVLMGLYMAWKLVFDIDLVEYNRISQLARFVFCSCTLLAIIDLFLVSGWALFVIPLVGLGGLVAAAVLFFTDLECQKQNMLPMFLMVLLAIAGAVAGWLIWGAACVWPITAMGLTAMALLLACIFVLRGGFLLELKRRFHVK